MKVCPKCYAVFDGKKWNGAAPIRRQELKRLDRTICPACRRVRDKIVFGTVYLDGEVVASRSGEILKMIRREEENKQARDHSSRILDIRHDGRKMTIRTANSPLAIHIAKQCKKAFKGRIEIFKDTPGHRPRNKQSEGTVAVKWIQCP